jgi:predicted Zn-dependent protease
MHNKKQLTFFILIPLLFAACAGKGVVKEPSDAEINAEAAKAYAEVKSKSKLSTHKEWNAMVQRVAQRIAQSSGENFQWETILIESNEVNAWCMPGGKMAVYTGIMPVLKTEGALAAVMGHEVAHATRRHGKQQYAKSMNTNLMGMIAGGAVMVGGQLLCKTETCKKASMIGGAAGGLAATFFTMKFSRTDESDADRFGQIYMAKAGYDPAESIKLWERMGAAAGGKKPPEFMSTHPSDTTRQQNLRSWLPETQVMYQQSQNKYGLGSEIK